MKLYDESHMKRAIELAKKGEGWVHPNPLVGAVIVKDNRIIGEGYHKIYGKEHAERNALKSLVDSAKGATMYVTLEPCCHEGKQPPCTEAVIESGIKRVVVGSLDPNPKVAGKGIEILRSHGIEVETGVLQAECDELNSIFFHYITHKTPYVIMKYAMTMDGKIATKTKASKWITGNRARNEVQRIRHKCMGIMVGINTVVADDPMLNCRRDTDRNPTRIICDSHLSISMDSNIVKTAGDIETIVAYADEDVSLEKKLALEDKGIKTAFVSKKDGKVDLKALMEYLGKSGIDSVLLEGGAELNYSALLSDIVNEVCVFVAPKIFGGAGLTPVGGSGVELPDEAFGFCLTDVKRIDEDLMLTYKRSMACLQE